MCMLMFDEFDSISSVHGFIICEWLMETELLFSVNL